MLVWWSIFFPKMWCFPHLLQLGLEGHVGIVMLKSPRDGVSIKILVEVQP